MKQTRREFIRTILVAAVVPLLRDIGVLPEVKVGDLCHCGHCGKVIDAGNAEVCWYCEADLCVDCWDRIGHCGHVEAHRQNHEAAMVRQPGEPTATVRNVHWTPTPLDYFWTADLYHDGVKVGVTGNYYEFFNKETGQRYPREDQILMSNRYLCEHGQGEDCWQCGKSKYRITAGRLIREI